MNIEQLTAASPGATIVRIDHQGEATQALLFRREAIDPDFAEDELEVWLETAEEEEADEDLVLCGVHPVGDDTQVERLFYYRRSEGTAGPVYSVDVDGTVVPGTLEKFTDTFDAFEPL